MHPDEKRLNNWIILVRVSTLLVTLVGLVCLSLFLSPSRVASFIDPEKEYQGQIIVLMLGLFFLIFGLSAFFFAAGWKRRLLWVYRKVQPVDMFLMVEENSSSDSTQYTAILTRPKPSSGRPDQWQVPLWFGPKKNQPGLKNEPMWCQVYFDPDWERPMVIRTEYGLLWTMGGKSAAQKIH